MFLKRLAKDEDIVEENNDELTKRHVEHTVHHGLKRRGRIRQPKWHHKKLEMVVVGAEGRFGHIS